MNTLHKRWAMFLGLCIPSRFLLSFILSKLSKTHLRILGFILLLPVIGWTYIYLTKSRMSGGETFGQPIWWDFMRPLHAGLYLTASLMAISQNNKAWIPIAADTIIGLLSFVHHHKLR
jgi:hypothetical protein